MVDLLERDHKSYVETLWAEARAYDRSVPPSGDEVEVRKTKSKDGVDEIDWSKARKEWSSLLKSLGQTWMHLDKLAETIVRRSLADPRLDIVKASGGLDTKTWAMVGPMLQGYARSAVPRIMKSAAAEYWRITKQTLPDPAEEMAVESAQLSGAELVQRISNRSQQAIQDAVMEGIAQGRSIEAIAADIKNSRIGLTSRDAIAVANYTARLKAEDRPKDQVQRMASKYRQRKLRQRSEVIARTEMSRARNMGFDMAWQLGVSEGVIDPGDLREWLARDPCPICQDLDGQKAPIGNPFTSQSGQYTFMRPPAHPNCRCTMVLDL